MRLIDADELKDIFRRSSFWDWSIKEDKSAHEWVENIINNMDIIEVAFLCDREKCEQCNDDDCQHTKDIIHAISFDKIDNTKYIEKTPTIDAEPVVRCKDCRWYEPSHILHKDGTKTYVEEDDEWTTSDSGINVGGQCIHHCGLKIYCTAHDRENANDYENIVIFRNPTDFCSYGERREP